MKLAFNGLWEQECTKQAKSVMTFTGEETLIVHVGDAKKQGTWKVKRGHLYLKYDDQKKKEKWNIDSIDDSQYYISRDGNACTGKKM